MADAEAHKSHSEISSEWLLLRAGRAADHAARLRAEAGLMAERCVSAINLNGMADRIRDGLGVMQIELHFRTRDGKPGERMVARIYPEGPLLEDGDAHERHALEATLRDVAFRTVAIAEDEIRQAGIEIDEEEPTETAKV